MLFSRVRVKPSGRAARPSHPPKAGGVAQKLLVRLCSSPCHTVTSNTSASQPLPLGRTQQPAVTTPTPKSARICRQFKCQPYWPRILENPPSSAAPPECYARTDPDLVVLVLPFWAVVSAMGRQGQGWGGAGETGRGLAGPVCCIAPSRVSRTVGLGPCLPGLGGVGVHRRPACRRSRLSSAAGVCVWLLRWLPDPGSSLDLLDLRAGLFPLPSFRCLVPSPPLFPC